MTMVGRGNKVLLNLFKGADLNPKNNFRFLKEGLVIVPHCFATEIKLNDDGKWDKHHLEKTLFYRMFSRVPKGKFHFYFTRLKKSVENMDYPRIAVTFHLRALKLLALGRRMQASELRLLYNCGLRDFSGVNLFGSDFYKVNLAGASLMETDLFWANFYKANLFEVNLKNANLSGANLAKANLSRANLFETDLSCANLYKANLAYANLNKTNLNNANIFETNFTGTILEVKNNIKS